MTDLIAIARECGAHVSHSTLGGLGPKSRKQYSFDADQLAAFAARIAKGPTMTIDIERMLSDCVPGGSVCDPQQVADDIREWFAAQPAAGAPDALAEFGAWWDAQPGREKGSAERARQCPWNPTGYFETREGWEASRKTNAPDALAVLAEYFKQYEGVYDIVNAAGKPVQSAAAKRVEEAARKVLADKGTT